MRHLAIIATLACACGGPRPAVISTAAAPVSTATTPPWPSTIPWHEPPIASATTPFTPPVPKQHVLASGVRVWLVPRQTVPLVTARLIIRDAGSAQDGPRAGLALLTAELLREGTKAQARDEFTMHLESQGVTLTTTADERSTIITSTGTTVAAAVAPMLDLVRSPRFAAADFERRKAERLDELARAQHEPSEIADRVFRVVSLGQHPYGAPPRGHASAIKRLTVKDVRQFWAAHYQPTRASLVVVGTFNEAELTQATAPLQAWRAVTAPTRPGTPAVAGPSKPVLAVVDRPGAAQTVIIVGKRWLAAGDARLPGLDVINTLLGGSFASRLNTRLREELGYTYGASSRMWTGKLGGRWRIMTSVRADVTLPALREVLKVLDHTRQAPVPAEEWQQTQHLLIRGWPSTFDTNDGIADALTSLIVDELPFEWLTTQREGIATAQAERVQAQARTLWEAPAIVLVGDLRHAPMADLTTLGLPIVAFNAAGQPHARLPTEYDLAPTP